jgi:hypothetical protein
MSTLAHVGKLVKPDSHVVVGTFCKRDFWHLSRLKTATTNAFHQFPNMSRPHFLLLPAPLFHRPSRDPVAELECSGYLWGCTPKPPKIPNGIKISVLSLIFHYIKFF